ncbi:MAG: hypothetical protein Q8N60_01290 [Candidatus Diapherotrites archaeon]|nr:hypothetical protein [Candidatus Diapherotrites archaeon]
MNPLSYLVTRFAAKIIAVDDTAVPREQLRLLYDLLQSEKIELKGKDAKKLLECLKRKHAVNSITVVRLNNRLVCSSEGNGAMDAERAVDLFKFISGDSTKPDAVAVKRNSQWHMLFPSNGKLLIIKANNSLSTLELRVIAKDIEKVLQKQFN